MTFSTIASDIMQEKEFILNRVHQLLAESHPIHPFEEAINPDRFESLLSNWLAVSVAFPYLQAGAQRDLIMAHINSDTDLTEDEEVTLAVGSYLTSDETSVNHILLTSGLPGLPHILNTRQNFHSSLLRADIHTILGRSLKPAFSPVTRNYLMQLYEGLASLNIVTRVAYMVSFEAHAGRMLTGLLERIVETFPVEKARLVYFQVHVGDNNPAEAYHVAMTSSMITQTIQQNQSEDFRANLLEAYRLNINWCQAICSDQPLQV